MAHVPAAFDRWVHEIRNQLCIVLGFSEILLREMQEDDARRSDIREIHGAAERAMSALARPPQWEDGHR